jgi:hypothetical protein
MKIRIKAWKWNAGVATMRRPATPSQYGWSWVSTLLIGQVFEAKREPAFNPELGDVFFFKKKLGDSQRPSEFWVEEADVEVLEE